MSGQNNYLVKEAAKELRCSENVVRNLIYDKRLRVMRMPTMIVPDFELDRFRQEVLNSQEDLSRYSDKRFVKEPQAKVSQTTTLFPQATHSS